MRTYDEYKQILILWGTLKNKKEIARITGIPRPTVRDCIKRYGDLAGLEAQKQYAIKSTPDHLLTDVTHMRQHQHEWLFCVCVM